MDTMKHADLAKVLDEVEKSIETLGRLGLEQEGPVQGWAIDAADHALFSLEAARAALRALMGLGPAPDLPVGHPHRAGTPQASTGSRRTGGIVDAGSEKGPR